MYEALPAGFYFCLPFICVLCPCRHLEEANQTLEAMLRPKVTTLPGHIQAVYVQNMVKLYASILQQKEQAGEKEAAQEITQLMIERLPQFVQSADLEVQERVRELNYLGIYHGAGLWFSVTMHIFCKLLSVTKLTSCCSLMPSLKAASKIFIQNNLI